MKIAVIYAHPYSKSFNNTIFETVLRELKAKSDVDVIDLNRDNFNPVLTEKDLAVYAQGKSTDPLVEKYQQIIKNADHIFLIFPVWWAIMPAILKGFIDKVLLKDFAFDKPEGKLPKGLLTHIKSATIINTMSSPVFYYNLFIKQPLRGSIIKGTLKFCGIKKVKWLKIGMVDTVKQKKRLKFIKKIETYCRNLEG